MRKKHWSVASRTHPDRGLNLQPRYVLWPGIEPATFWCRERHSNNWATWPGQTFLVFNDLASSEEYFAGCPPVGICLMFFSGLDQGVIGLGEEDHRHKASCPSHPENIFVAPMFHGYEKSCYKHRHAGFCATCQLFSFSLRQFSEKALWKVTCIPSVTRHAHLQGRLVNVGFIPGPAKM